MREIKSYADVEYITAHKCAVYSPQGDKIRFYDFIRKSVIEVEDMFFKGFVYNAEDLKIDDS